MERPSLQLIYGRHPTIEALQSGHSLDRVLLQQGIRGEFEKQIRRLCKENNVPMQVVPKERLAKITRANHQGVIAFASLLTYYRLSDVMPGIYEKGEIPLILLLDGVTDVRNFGAIARSAEISGVHAIVLPHKGTAQINAEAIKASAGALNNIMICREKSLLTAIDLLETSGLQILLSDLQSTRPVYDIDFTRPVAIVMGSENEGIRRAILQRVKDHFIIPQKGTTNSFNVSVAAGIILYEVMRQRAKDHLK